MGMTADAHIVGRVKESGVYTPAIADDCSKKRRIARITAADAMLAQNPYVATSGTGLDRHRGNVLVVGVRPGVEDDIYFQMTSYSAQQSIIMHEEQPSLARSIVLLPDEHL